MKIVEKIAMALRAIASINKIIASEDWVAQLGEAIIFWFWGTEVSFTLF
jgi:hypothetical protein